MRLAYYAGASTAAAAACLLKAFHQRPNFYSATVYLSQSNACLLILTNLVLVAVCSFIYGLQRLLYGRLRPIEIEQLSEKAWYAVLDTLLAMPSFRDDVGGWLLAMFTMLLAGKIWGWIGEGRVDILEQQPPANPVLFHVRLATSLVVSVLFDIWMLDFCIQTVVAHPGPGMMVIFTFEFAILTVFSLFTLSRYCLDLVGIRLEKKQLEKAIEERKEEIKAERAAARQNETEDGRPAPADPPSEEPIEVDENEVDVPGWEEKRRYLFALEVFTDFIKLLIYMIFFTVSITFNGLPMHIMRDVYMTFASFSKRVGDYMAYRKATSDMNTRYPDATTEEIRGDSCIVCRETMVAWEQPAEQQEARPAVQQPNAAPAPSRRRDEGLRAKKLPCGHILHLRCLKAWLERQQVCPTCRRPVVTAETAAPPAQGGVAAANPAAPGQPPQQPGRRQPRARIFDLGPVRIGFVNGPGANIPNIIRQMQNRDAAAGQDGGQNGGQQNQNRNEQGPNHLGLQEPYAPAGQQAPTPSNPMAISPSTSIQIQMMQMEQRLMHEAHNLNLDQQQYATLRAMEAELARLRASHMPAQQPVGTGTAIAAAQRHYLPPVSPPMPLPVMMPWMGQQQPIMRDLLQGPTAQQMGNGHEHLPEGMVLPEGWTVTPLQRVNPPTRSTANVQPTPVRSTIISSAGSAASGAAAVSVNGSAPGTAQIQPQPQASTAAEHEAMPTNDNGSPLFVPTTAHPQHEQPEQSSRDATETVTSQAAQATPWGSNGWTFSGDEHATAGNSPHANEASTTADNNEAASGREGQAVGNGDANKKTAHVEDVPDAGT